jgi:putative hydrolase of the HAD superfamily
VLHVGDDAFADVEGARRAGLTPVWVNRAGGAWPLSASPPPLAVQTLAELADLLD